MVKFYSSIAVLLLLGLGVWLFGSSLKKTGVGVVKDFSSCVQAGNKILESMPRKCRASEGEIFTEQIAEIYDCREDSQCSEGSYCGGGRCAKFSPETFCRQDSECKLVNEDFNYGCCWSGVCQAIDYSRDNWIPVNMNVFEEKRQSICATQNACGPNPSCPANIVNGNYEARCVGGLCQKLPVR